MISHNDNDVALTVLRKYDSQCQMILDSSNKIKLYDYDKIKNTWVLKDESEGALYLVKRNIPPVYKFVILSKCNKPGSYPSTTEIPLSQHLMSQINQTYFMFKNECGIIQAIFFPSKSDCERFCLKVERIIKTLKNESAKSYVSTPINCKQGFVESVEDILSNKSVPESSPNGKDKIFNMLESARQRYEETHVEKWSRPIDVEELFKSTINVNQDPGTPVIVDTKSSQYTPLSQTVPNIFKDINPHSKQTMPGLPQIRNMNTVPDKIDQSISSRNGSNTLTVTELEKYLVQNASSNQKRADVEDDDDSLLLSPNKFEDHRFPLNKEQLKDAFIYLLQNDDDGRFVTQLHSAYLQSLNRNIIRK